MGAPASPVSAEVIVSQPLALSHRVQIQPIRVKKTNGTTATTLGDAAESAYIIGQINRIWAQVGIRIDWLPFNDYENDFAYDGTPANYTSTPRPGDHLNQIVDGAGSPPKSADGNVINMFFVEIVPGFPKLSDNTANGLAFLDFNGIAVHVGTNLLDFTAGRDVIASVIAHEIGHNLALPHFDETSDNLMNSSGGSAERLDFLQRNLCFTDNGGADGFELLEPLPQPSGYLQWASTNSVSGGPEGDDDQDDIANVIEFMLGLDPHGPSSLPPITPGDGSATWTIPKYPAATADGLIYQAQSSDNLALWLNAGAVGSGSTVMIDNAYTLSVRLNTGSTRRFTRLNVDSAPANSFAAPPAALRVAAPLSLPRVTPEPGYARSAFDPAGSGN